MDDIEAPPPADLIGTILGERYRVEQRLSQGGMGMVYRARHVVLDSALAVKVLLKPQNDEDRQRFLQEAKLASLIKHPNTVQIIDFGVLPSGQPYLAMELLSGRTLADEVLKGPMDALRVCQIGVQIARGLHAVHAQGIVHRDMKPDNVFLLNQDGNPDFVKIVDFGIAKSVIAAAPAQSLVQVQEPTAGPVPHSDLAYAATGEYEPAAAANPPVAAPVGEPAAEHGMRGLLHTRAGSVLGTPPYMSPEQCSGKIVDVRSDQYSFGCMLYELLVGQWVFAETAPLELMKSHVLKTPQSLRARAPQLNLPAALDETVMRLIAKQPEQRFASMQEVAATLSSLVDSMLVARREPAGLPPSLGSQRGTPTKGSQLVLRGRPIPLRVVGVALLGMLVLVLGGVGFFGYRLYRAAPRPTLEPGELQAVKTRAVQVLRQIARTAADGSELGLRRDAILALGETQDPTLRPELEALLGDLPVQAAAAAALGKLDDRQAVPRLRAALGQAGDSPLRLTAARALVELGDPQGEAPLAQALAQGTPEQRLRAALLLCDRHSAAAEKLLLEVVDQGLLQDESAVLGALGCLLGSSSVEAARARLHHRLSAASSPRQQIAVAAVLAQVGDPQGRQVLRGLAERPGLPQLPAARALAAPDVPEVAELFRAVLADRQAQEAAQLLATEGLGQSGRLLDVRLLDGFLGAGKTGKELRAAAAAAALRLGAADPTALGAESLRWARGSLGASDWQRRASAALVFGDSASPEAVALLQALLKDQDARVRRGSARALGRRSEETALLALKDALGDADSEVRLETLRSLGRLSKNLLKTGTRDLLKRTRSWFAEILKTGAPQEQILARTALLQLGDDSQKPALWAMQSSPDPVVRRFLLDQAPPAVEQAALLLSDPDAGVRFAAAQKLAESGDARAIAVLNQTLKLGGADAIVAYGLLTRLGQKIAQPAALQTALQADRPVLERMTAVEALVHLPVPLALPLLLTAAHDAEPLVRRLCAEVDAELEEGAAGAAAGFPVLRFLLADSDPAVKNRAAALWARVALPSAPPLPSASAQAAGAAVGLPASAGPAATAPAAATPADAVSAHGDDPAGNEESAGQGKLLLEAPEGALFQVDGGKWQSATGKGISLAQGAHHITTLGGDYEVTIAADKKARIKLAASPIDEAVQLGGRAYQKQEYGKAQSQYDRASALCSRDRAHRKACPTLELGLALDRGHIFEQQKRLGEAMMQYQKALDGGHGKARVQAAEAMSRLAPQLGKIILRSVVKGKCQERVQWLLPGKKQKIKMGDKSLPVSVHAGETAEIGSCP